ncbi:MAG: TolC family outer membrane protein [Labrys sp. (in: a-proteobacteria)]
MRRRIWSKGTRRTTVSARFSSIIAPFIILGPTVLLPTNAGAQSLREAVDLAMTAHYGVQEAQANRNATAFELEQAKGLFMPTLDVDAGVGPEGQWTSGAGDQWSLSRSVGVSLNWSVFDGGANGAERARQAARVDSAAFRVMSRSEAIALDTVLVYLDLLRSEQLVALARDNLAEYERFVDRISDRVRSGASGVADLRVIEERIEQAKVALQQADQKRDDTIASFIRYTGQKPRKLWRPQAPTKRLPKSVEDIIARAWKANPDIAAAVADIDVAAAERAAAKAVFYPKLSLEGRVAAAEDTGGGSGSTVDASMVLRLRYNIFRGGIDTNIVSEQTERLAESEFRADRIRQEVALQARQSWIALQGARESIALLKRELAISEQIRTVFGDEFEAGKRSLIDLFNAQSDVFTAKAAVISADYTRDFAVYRLLAVQGQLLETLAIAMAPEAIADARMGEILRRRGAVAAAGQPPFPPEPDFSRPMLRPTLDN